MITVTQLISDIRSVLDEVNKSRIDDKTDIIPALNRAQSHAASVMSRHYEQPLLATVQISTVSGQREYPIPRDSLEDRLEKVEVANNGLYYEVQAISYRNATYLETTSSSSIPTNYAIIGKNFRIYPAASSYPMRLWYLKAPLPLAQQYGQVTKVGTDFIVMDQVGSLVVGDYVNTIDQRTGELIGQLQVKRINGKRVEFRATPDRATVNQVPVSTLTALTTPTISTQEILEQDDFLCPTGTSCIPFMTAPMSNYYISYAEGEIRRKTGEESQLQDAATKMLEKDVERSWVGRESTFIVKQKNRHWETPRRRPWGL